jgi:hypothetical protein
MARPIEPTPALRGKDAATFLKAVQNPKPYTRPTFDLEKMLSEVQRIRVTGKGACSVKK